MSFIQIPELTMAVRLIGIQPNFIDYYKCRSSIERNPDEAIMETKAVMATIEVTALLESQAIIEARNKAIIEAHNRAIMNAQQPANYVHQPVLYAKVISSINKQPANYAQQHVLYAKVIS